MNILKILLFVIITVLATGGVVLVLAGQTIGEFDIIQFILVKVYGFGLLFLAYYLGRISKEF